MEDTSVEKQHPAEPPPSYQPPNFTGNFSSTAPGYSMSNQGPQVWPSDPPSYSDGFTAGRSFNEPQHGNFQYQRLENETPGSYGRPAQRQPQTIIINQPVAMWGQGQYAPLADPPEDYMCYSIFVTLCCCWLIGIFAIMRSAECRSAIAAGDRVTAEIKSREARSKAHLALVLGIVASILTGVIAGVYYGLYFNSTHK